MDRERLVAAVFALLVVGGTLFGGGAALRTRGADTGSKPLEVIDLGSALGANNDYLCAAWSSDYTVAMMAGEVSVAGNDGVALYDYPTDTWSLVPGAPVSEVFEDIDFGFFSPTGSPGPDSNTFVLAGSTDVYYYNYTLGHLEVIPNNPSSAPFVAISAQGGGNSFYVATSSEVWYVYNSGSAWVWEQVTGIASGSTIYDLDYYPYYSDILILATQVDGPLETDIYSSYWGSNAVSLMVNMKNFPYTPTRFKWNPQASGSGSRAGTLGGDPSGDYCLITYEKGRVLRLYSDGTNQTYQLTGDSITLNDIDWIGTPNEVTVAGDAGTIYRFQPLNGVWMNMSDTASFNGDIEGVASKEYSSPSFHILPSRMVGGVSLLPKVYDINVAQGITVNTLYPHINYIDLYDNNADPWTDIPADNAGAFSHINGQIDVDPGTLNNDYYLTVNITHNSGVSDLNYTLVQAWYDGGATGGASTYGATGGNLAFSFNYSFWNNSFWIEYPTTGEIELWNVISANVNATTVVLSFDFLPRQQVRNASGDAGTFNESAGKRYGGPDGVWDVEDQSSVNALNTPYTWDIHVVVRDHGGGRADAYDEFGVFKYTSLATSGLPGDLYGQGPPNVEMVLFPVGNVTFYANCEYALSTYIQADLVGTNTGKVIQAANFSVEGGTLSKTAFTGATQTNQQYLLPQWTAPRDNGFSTNTTNAVFGGSSVIWYCNPGIVPEDYYTGSAIYVLAHN
ncbi:MAG: hypothetical protein J7L61_03520 [Thermoplasmata archaeon]|nr:hypothetical protein [Thermoplasmata archaeon]